ncbi:MAG: hypothetical protein GWM90_00225 [Gemmatimonadetes bacterium]|nr:hypothetical protein [Gemmatimonadota bacterium]NIQ51952.1 hypothetical protein [Gemmatimonadota bacterium]NIU72055.1 hypothetical protein [Gammaproteobacteria bacterium]NIX42615.1 hypothetical protein [Gemmatimonadota bacterium]
MARKFTDRSGRSWIVEREHGRHELVFRPAAGSPGDEQVAPLPTSAHTQDPYELSDGELQRMLERARPRYKKPKGPPPF